MPKDVWSSEEDATLINFVRNYEALYNVKCKSYRNLLLKHKLWRKIGKILNKTDNACWKRWCYVRDYYIRRRGKGGSSGKQAQNRSELLSFLDGPSLRSNIIAMDMNLNDSSDLTDNTHDKGEETLTFKQKTEDLSYCNDEQTIDNINIFEYNKLVEITPDNTESDKKRQNTHATKRLVHHNSKGRRNESAQNELDETDLFFGSMAKIVKRLPRFEQAQLRMQIGSLVGNAELRYISNDESHDSTISPRPGSRTSSEIKNPLQ